MPTVSVCIPAYEQPQFFRRSLRSVLEQEFTDFEVVVTDDSRDDGVLSVVRELWDERVTYIKNPVRRGSPENWNVAVEHSTGELVKLIHHDDWLTSRESLGEFVRLLDASPEARFGFSASKSVDPTMGVKRIHYPAQQIDGLRRDPRLLLLGNWIGAPSATIYRRSVMTQFDASLRWVVDIDFYLAVLCKWPRFVCTPEPLVSVTDGAPHQVSNQVMQDPAIELSEWFRLYAKWAPRFPLRADRARFLDSILERGRVSWRDHRRLGLRGRGARLFVIAGLLHDRGLLAKVP